MASRTRRPLPLGRPPLASSHPLRRWRAVHNLTLQDLATLAEVSTASISRVERRLQYPRLDLVDRIATISGGELGRREFWL
jgi:transcriptional regulator with XRE-family HTH domain